MTTVSAGTTIGTPAAASTATASFAAAADPLPEPAATVPAAPIATAIATATATATATPGAAGAPATHTAAASGAARHTALPARGSADHTLAVQDRLASWVCDLSLLHELTERLARSDDLQDALHEVLRAGATLVGARRGLLALEPADGLGPDTTAGLGLGHSDLGALETVHPDTAYGPAPVPAPGRDRDRDPAPGDPYADGEPRGEGGPYADGGPSADGSPSADGGPYAEGSPSADGSPYTDEERVHRDLRHEPGLAPRHREVAAQLGLGASYALRLTAGSTGRLGTAVWFYDEPAAPAEGQRRLIGLYLRYATEHLARCLALHRAERASAALTAELLPARLPRVSGVRLAVRHESGPRGGGDWYDALPLPEGALGLSVGGVTGAGPGAVAAMGRLRASLRAYAVMEGEDPVAVLSDLELLLRLAEPARSATALFACVTALPAGGRKLSLAGAGHCPPLLVGERRCEFVETTLSAPLNMLNCWEAPGVEVHAAPGESVLLYTDGLLHRTGEPTDRAFARLHAAARAASRETLRDPERLADHVLRTLLPDGLDAAHGREDLVLLVARVD